VKLPCSQERDDDQRRSNRIEEERRL